MSSRINYAAVAPEALEVLKKVSQYVAQSGLDSKLVNLVDIRVSQINGCGY